VAEIMEGRRAQLEDELRDSGAADPADEVSRAIDRWVWYAGWADKIAQVAGGANPVAGPYFNFTVPEPTGVVGIIAPPEPSLLGLVSSIAPVIVSGNVAVAVASERSPLPAVSLAEALATSDVPGGVINVLTGSPSELVPWLAAHMDVNAIDLTGCPDDLIPEAERAAADNVKRVHRAGPAEQHLSEITAFVEFKTVWHPMGA
jgi:acyl-CoA reductase-like NAD-dependent aldehyde dehydrogenase